MGPGVLEDTVVGNEDSQKALQLQGPTTQSQLPLKPWWARMASLLPPFLIMTGPRGLEQGKGRASGGLQVGKEGREGREGGRERRRQLKQTLCSGEKQVRGQTCGQPCRVVTLSSFVSSKGGSHRDPMTAHCRTV